MREIKFRGWDGFQMLPPQDISQSKEYWKWLGKVDCELMQYTGLKDVSGTEIYEGDVLQNTWDYAFFVVEFIEGEYPHQSNADSTNNKWNFKYGGTKIIGNIYENPELLK